jgi:hypothetical protein
MIIKIDSELLACDMAMSHMRFKYGSDMYDYDLTNEIQVIKDQYLNEYENLCVDILNYIQTYHTVNDEKPVQLFEGLRFY